MGMEDMDNFMTEVCVAFLSSKEEHLKTGLMRQGVETELFEYGHLRTPLFSRSPLVAADPMLWRLHSYQPL
jgi:hypothetical protein